jgi:hypothetical protein
MIAVWAFLVDRHRKLMNEAAEGRVLVRQSDETRRALSAEQIDLGLQAGDLARRREEFDREMVSYRELSDENDILRRDLQNIDVTLHKLQLDNSVLADKQKELDARSTALAARYMDETEKAVAKSLTPRNFAACKERLLGAIERCREIGYAIPEEEGARLVAQLRADFETAVRKEYEREEQARIKAQIREEERVKREVERELRDLERERQVIAAALERALADAKDAHSAQVDELRARLTEAEAKAQRAQSMAEQTKAGNVYVISNIGSFGESVFKIGMTRRLEPLDRVKELGDASVPFPFDVHMVVACDDAPKLENALHRALHRVRLNRANPRKEFFRTDIETIRRIVVESEGEVTYVAKPEALEYRQSEAMSPEDAEYIEQVFDDVAANTGSPSEP